MEFNDTRYSEGGERGADKGETKPEDDRSLDLPGKGGAEHQKREQDGEVTDDSPLVVQVPEGLKSLFAQESALVNPAVVELLTSGFVERFLPGLCKSQTTIDQIRSSQGVLLDTVHQETAKFRECHSVKHVEDTMVKARHYHAKLLRLRREMTSLHEKSKKLKKRALRLQQQKQSEELMRAHTREHELEKERMLTARLAPSPPSPT